MAGIRALRQMAAVATGQTSLQPGGHDWQTYFDPMQRRVANAASLRAMQRTGDSAQALRDSRWDRDHTGDVFRAQMAKRYRTRGALLFFIACIFGAVLIEFISHGLYDEWAVLPAAIANHPVKPFAKHGMSAFLVLCATLTAWRYLRGAPAMSHLSDRQRKLLGLPPAPRAVDVLSPVKVVETATELAIATAEAKAAASGIAVAGGGPLSSRTTIAERMETRKQEDQSSARKGKSRRLNSSVRLGGLGGGLTSGRFLGHSSTRLGHSASSRSAHTAVKAGSRGALTRGGAGTGGSLQAVIRTPRHDRWQSSVLGLNGDEAAIEKIAQLDTFLGLNESRSAVAVSGNMGSGGGGSSVREDSGFGAMMMTPRVGRRDRGRDSSARRGSSGGRGSTGSVAGKSRSRTRSPPRARSGRGGSSGGGNGSFHSTPGIAQARLGASFSSGYGVAGLALNSGGPDPSSSSSLSSPFRGNSIRDIRGAGGFVGSGGGLDLGGAGGLHDYHGRGSAVRERAKMEERRLQALRRLKRERISDELMDEWIVKLKALLATHLQSNVLRAFEENTRELMSKQVDRDVLLHQRKTQPFGTYGDVTMDELIFIGTRTDPAPFTKLPRAKPGEEGAPENDPIAALNNRPPPGSLGVGGSMLSNSQAGMDLGMGFGGMGSMGMGGMGMGGYGMGAFGGGGLGVMAAAMSPGMGGMGGMGMGMGGMGMGMGMGMAEAGMGMNYVPYDRSKAPINLMAHRFRLERYLRSAEGLKRGYVLERLHQFVSGGGSSGGLFSTLSGVNWSEGVPFQGRPWTPDLPTDAKIIAHAFVAFMDNEAGFPNNSEGIFNQRFFDEVDETEGRRSAASTARTTGRRGTANRRRGVRAQMAQSMGTGIARMGMGMGLSLGPMGVGTSGLALGMGSGVGAMGVGVFGQRGIRLNSGRYDTRRRAAHEPLLKEVQSLDPHYEVIDHTGRRWPVRPGENNIFEAIVIFMLVVSRHCGGKLSSVDLCSKVLDRLGIGTWQREKERRRREKNLRSSGRARKDSGAYARD